MTCSVIMNNHTATFLGAVLTQLGRSPISPTNMSFKSMVWRQFCTHAEQTQILFHEQNTLTPAWASLFLQRVTNSDYNLIFCLCKSSAVVPIACSTLFDSLSSVSLAWLTIHFHIVSLCTKRLDSFHWDGFASW